MEQNYRNLCQVFTPYNIVETMLNWCKYKKNLYGKKVIENSCGDGHILVQIIERYIKDCLKKQISIKEIKKGLEEDIYAFETDEEQYIKCIENLNKVAEKYNITDVNWKNILKQDALKIKQEEKFDYVIRKSTIYKI